MTFRTQIDCNDTSKLLWVRPNEAWPTQIAALVASEGVAPDPDQLRRRQCRADR